MRQSKLKISVRSMVFAAVAFGLTGCGAIDGVELNGGIFDATGLSSLGKTKTERKMPVRGPLVMPPTKELRAPGTAVAQPGPQAWPVDPEQQRVASAKRQAEIKKKNCEDGIFAKGKKADVEDLEQLTGNDARACESVLSKIIKNNLPGRDTDDNPY